MTHHMKLTLLAFVGISQVACQFYARSAEDYSSATKELLASKEQEIKTCYDALLAKDEKAHGVVAVNFTVAAKTGVIEDPTIDSEQTTAPEPLQHCVLEAMKGLTLDPPDAREGVASFAYDFSANAPRQL